MAQRIAEEAKTAVSSYNVYAPYPNPFEKNTCISFNLSRPSKVKVMVYNSIGQPVNTVLDERRDAGLHRIDWNGEDDRGVKLPSGIYFYTVETENRRTTSKVIMVH